MDLNFKAILDLSEDKEDFSEGDLILVICCRKCDAMYDINPDTVALALLTNASVWDYIKSIQLGKCRECNPSHNCGICGKRRQ